MARKIKNPVEEEFSGSSLEELQKMKDNLEDYIQQAKDSKKSEALEEIKEIVRLHNLPYDEVCAAIRIVAKRGKAPPLYRNPDKPKQTWSGKGDAPDWYATHDNPESLRIPGT